MDKRKSSSGVLGTGGLVLTIIQATHPEWLGNRPWILPAAFGLFLLSLAVFLFQFKWVQRIVGVRPISEDKGPEKNLTATEGIAVGGDVSGSHLSHRSGHSFIGTDAIRAHYDHERIRLPPSKVEPSPIPTLKYHAGWMCGIYENYPGAWTKTEPDPPFTSDVAIAVFENPSAPKGHSGIPVRRVEAHLKFHGSNGMVLINTAYWRDEDCNLIDIPAGHERAVILGHFSKDGAFTTYQNEYSYPNGSAWDASRSLCDPVNIPFANNLLIDITLKETKHDRTVENFMIEIDRATKSIKVVEP